MAHEVLGERFYGSRNMPAWHGKGTIDNESRTAAGALEIIGSYRVMLAPLVTRFPLKSTGAQFDVAQNAILRGPQSAIRLAGQGKRRIARLQIRLLAVQNIGGAASSRVRRRQRGHPAR